MTHIVGLFNRIYKQDQESGAMSFLRKLFIKQGTKKAAPPSNAAPPSAEDLEKAKKIFFDNLCNYSMMGHEGWLDEYREYHVSKEQEGAWGTKFIAQWVSQLSADDFTALYYLQAANAFEALPDLFRLAEKGDSYAKLSIADVIWSLKNMEGIEPTLEKQAEEIALQLWSSLVNKNNVWISEPHKGTIPKEGLKKFHATTPEEYVANRAKNSLEKSRRT